VAEWRARGYELLALSHPGYPDNLRVVENRPPLLFVAGGLTADDRHSAAVIGTRQPSEHGRRLTREVAVALSHAGYVVFSGLAAGIDTEAHGSVLDRGGRTVAVIGTGLDHAYPPGNADLQARIAREGAVISQFWPESTATRQSFPARNAVMSGLTLGSVIVEASEHSGTRIQARHALAQGRVVVLMTPVLEHGWAQDLAEKPGVVVAQDGADAVAALKR
jgi:DNA processing protein